jgi:hypothetical protein
MNGPYDYDYDYEQGVAEWTFARTWLQEVSAYDL